MAALRKAGGLALRSALGLFYVAPWAWVLTVTTMIVMAMVQFDRFPSYGDPDPKWIEGVFAFYWAMYLLLIASLLSPLVVAAETIVRLVSKTGIRGWTLAGYALGFALFGSIAFADAFGLMNWLLD